MGKGHELKAYKQYIQMYEEDVKGVEEEASKSFKQLLIVLGVLVVDAVVTYFIINKGFGMIPKSIGILSLIILVILTTVKLSSYNKKVTQLSKTKEELMKSIEEKYPKVKLERGKGLEYFGQQVGSNK